MASQRTLFEAPAAPRRGESTFSDNTKLPVHRWFRYSAGFSGLWAKEVISQRVPAGTEYQVLDPFAGSGTTLIASEQVGVAAYGLEAHPFVWRIARAKLAYRSNWIEYETRAFDVLEQAQGLEPHIDSYPPLIEKCFTPANLRDLDRLRVAWLRQDDGSALSELVWVTLVAILRTVSHVGTAPWQYVLPAKEKKKRISAFDAFSQMVRVVSSDMRALSGVSGPRARVLQGDARTCEGVADGSIDLVLTSPPYANNYDYADATRLEMSFMGDVRGWCDLQDKVRQHLVRSCSQHVPERSIDLPSVLSSDELNPIRGEITEVCSRLGRIRLEHGGKKTYHLLVACYFLDLARVWHSLRRVCKPGAEVCFVVGDSAPYGVYVPVIDWLGRLALAAGFSNFEFRKTRDRNVKWKNRKHRVPLCEGHLWVGG